MSRLPRLLPLGLCFALGFGVRALVPDGVAASTAPAAPAPPAKAVDPIAWVDGEPIDVARFEEAAGRKSPADGKALSLDEKKEVIQDLVEEQVLYREALRLGLDKDPKVQKVMVNTLLRNEVYSSVRNSDFTDEVLQAYYNAHRSEFIVPEKVQIKRILLKSGENRSDDEAHRLAFAAFERVRADPERFADVAAEVSEDPYRRRGGDVGFVSREGKPGLDPALVEAAFRMETGVVGEPFRNAEGWNVVLVAARREEVERTFQQMKGSVLRKVKNEKLKELYDAYVAKLSLGVKVKVDEARLRSIQVAGRPAAEPVPGALGGEIGGSLEEDTGP